MRLQGFTFPAYIYYKLSAKQLSAQEAGGGGAWQGTAGLVCGVSAVFMPLLVAIQIYQMVHP